MRLLIIEDEKNLLRILKKGFKEEGYGVEMSPLMERKDFIWPRICRMTL
jgi:DNA-binding response OmpR family regulator